MKTTNEVSFKVSAEDDKLILAIVNRALKDYPDDLDRLDLSMDLTACHCNGNPLKLKELLTADDFNFVHDLTGISRHINRETGALENCFSPRYSA